MEQIAFPNRRGFTLIEVLIAMLILLFSLIGSLYGIMAALNYNFGNALHSEAVKIAQEQLEINRNMNYAAVSVGDTDSEVQRQLRKASWVFQVRRSVQAVGTLKEITITVQWTFKNRNRSYVLQSILRQPV